MASIGSEPAQQEQSAARTHAAALYLCFFISGIAGLSYEVIWSKYLALLVGTTGMAQVIVLATFMGGLALGNQLLGGLADRVRSPLKLYAWLELGIGVYALLFDLIFLQGRNVFLALSRTDEPVASTLLAGKITAAVLTPLALSSSTSASHIGLGCCSIRKK